MSKHSDKLSYDLKYNYNYKNNTHPNKGGTPESGGKSLGSLLVSCTSKGRDNCSRGHECNWELFNRFQIML